MGLQIKNETVYVIYKDGEPYNGSGRKLVYTTRGAAQGVITNEAKDNAHYKYAKGSWWDLSNAEKDKLIEQELSKFQIVEYTPK